MESASIPVIKIVIFLVNLRIKQRFLENTGICICLHNMCQVEYHLNSDENVTFGRGACPRRYLADS